jgi:ribose transport system permease protein
MEPREDSGAPRPIGAATPSDGNLRRRGYSQRITRVGSRFGVVIFLVILALVFTFTNTSIFPTERNLQNVFGSNSILLIAALGSMVPLIVGEFDLSVGYMIGVATVVTATLPGQFGFGLLPTFLITIGLGAVIGLFNGILVTKVGISSFIATLGSGTVISGISLYVSAGNLLFAGVPQALKSFAQGFWFQIPILTVVAAACALLLWYITEHTPLGRRLYAVGMGRNAARLSGVRTNPLVIGAFVFSASMAALAGFLEVGYVGSGGPLIGPEFLLPSLAACYLGATTIRLGRFNVIGTVVAVILVAVGVNGLALNGAPDWLIPVFNGVVLLAAVGISRFASAHVRTT